MKATSQQKPKHTRAAEESIFSRILRIVFLVVFDAGAFWFIQNAYALGFTQMVVVIGVVAVMLNLIFLIPNAYPFRWMAIGLSFLILFTIYPMIFTIYVAFTNYGDGHLLTKEQAIPLIEKTTYLPEAGKSYSWTAFKSADGDYALWLINPEGETFLAKVGEEIIAAHQATPVSVRRMRKAFPPPLKVIPV
jgi:arabinogalactan oligomer / maltooligosaccharide transport system permease protein